MKCQNCGTEVGDANFCPSCGSAIDKGQSIKKNVSLEVPEASEISKKKKPIYKKVWFWAVFVILVFAVFLNLGNDKPKANEGSTKPNSQAVASTTNNTKGNSSTSSRQPESNKENQVLPKETKEDFIASCEAIPYKTLLRTPETYIGKRLSLIVQVSQVMDGGLFDNNKYYRVCAESDFGWYGDEYYMYDERYDKELKLLEDDIIQVYCEFAGTTTVTRALTNAKDEVCCIKAYYVNLLSESDSTYFGTSSTGVTITDESFADMSTGEKNAVISAKDHLKYSAYSRNELYDSLTSQYGDQYLPEEASFAISYLEENGFVDWKEEANKAAREHLKYSAYSRQELLDTLTSEYGDQFTEDEAYSAVTYLEENSLVDWKEEAVKAAKDHLKYSTYSRQELLDALTSEYGDQFTDEEANNAIDYLEVSGLADWKEEAVKAAKDHLQYSTYSRNELFDTLTSKYGDQFTAEEAEYALNQLDY